MPITTARAPLHSLLLPAAVVATHHNTMSTANNGIIHLGEATTTAAATRSTTISSQLSNDDPEKLLNEWLGELKTIIGVSVASGNEDPLCHFVLF